MACACKVNQDLNYLQKKYGIGGPKQKETNIVGNISAMFKDLFTYVILILCFPFFIFYATYTLIKHNGNIKITDVFRFKHSYN